jgi:hypothetical protein
MQSLPHKTPQRVPAVDSSAAVDKKLWRTHYIAAHDHLTDRLNKYDDWGSKLSNPQQAARNRQARTTIWGHVGVPKNRDPPAVLHHATLDPVKDLHGINPLLDQKKYNGKKVAEEHVLMRLHDAMLCRPRTWLNDAVIQDYSFFLNKVANESEASVLFLSPVKQND